MSIKSFNEFVSEAIASDYKAPADSDAEVKEYKPRSKGEEDFKKMHKVEKKGHPVAGDHVFTGDKKEVKK